jgi:hypothetical protein
MNHLGPKVRGLYGQAGGGELPPDLLNVVAYYKNGGTKLQYVDDATSKLMEELRQAPPAAEGVEVSKVIGVARRLEHDHLRRRLRRPIGKPVLKPRESIIKTYWVRREGAQTLLKTGKSLRTILRELRESDNSIVANDLPHERMFENRVIQLCRYKQYSRAITAIRKWSESAKIDRELAVELIQENYIEWDKPVTSHLLPAQNVWEFAPVP